MSWLISPAVMETHIATREQSALTLSSLQLIPIVKTTLLATRPTGPRDASHAIMREIMSPVRLRLLLRHKITQAGLLQVVMVEPTTQIIGTTRSSSSIHIPAPFQDLTLLCSQIQPLMYCQQESLAPRLTSRNWLFSPLNR